MFPNWTGWKTVKAILFVATGLVPAVVPAAWQQLAAAVIAGVGGVVVVLSGTSAGPKVVKP